MSGRRRVHVSVLLLDLLVWIIVHITWNTSFDGQVGLTAPFGSHGLTQESNREVRCIGTGPQKTLKGMLYPLGHVDGGRTSDKYALMRSGMSVVGAVTRTYGYGKNYTSQSAVCARSCRRKQPLNASPRRARLQS